MSSAGRARLVLYAGNAVIIAIALGVGLPLRIGPTATALIAGVASLMWTALSVRRFRAAIREAESGPDDQPPSMVRRAEGRSRTSNRITKLPVVSGPALVKVWLSVLAFVFGGLALATVSELFPRVLIMVMVTLVLVGDLVVFAAYRSGKRSGGR